jgi:hypothetical protein
VTNDISGMLHSKVGMVSQGVEYISITLDSGLIGNLAMISVLIMLRK